MRRIAACRWATASSRSDCLDGARTCNLRIRSETRTVRLVSHGASLQVRWDWDAGRWFAFVLVACAVVLQPCSQ